MPQYSVRIEQTCYPETVDVTVEAVSPDHAKDLALIEVRNNEALYFGEAQTFINVDESMEVEELE